MTDYTEKAAALRRRVVWASNEAIDAISQALDESHEAGRAEMKEEAAKEADSHAAMYRKHNAWGDFGPVCDSIASAIRDIT